jgi:hypothetical protein
MPAEPCELDIKTLVDQHPELAHLIRRWPDLGEGIREHILAVATEEVDVDAY